MKPLAAFLKRVEAASPAAVRAGAEALADEGRRKAGPLAPGIGVGPASVDGARVEAVVTSDSVEGQAPPAVREFGTSRVAARPYMRPMDSRAAELAAPAIARHLPGGKR